MRRRLRPLAVVAALAAAPAAVAAPPPVFPLDAQQPAAVTQVVPGVTVQRIERAGPQVIHVVRVRPSPLLMVRPQLTGNSPTERAPLTAALRAGLDYGVVAGINGDFFNVDSGYPSGLLMVAGELVNEPEATRSSLLLPPGQPLIVAQVALAGRLQAVDPLVPEPFPRRSFNGINRPHERPNEVILYTPRFGAVTPTADPRFEATIALDAGSTTLVNAPLAGTVVATKAGGGTTIAPGQVVVSAAGTARAPLVPELVVGRRVALEIAIPGVPPGPTSGIGGGPMLVRDGQPLLQTTEGLSTVQLTARTSRSAVGQTADGTVLMVTAEGPAQGSRGITSGEQANLMAQLGATTAIAMDSGSSAMLGVGDRLLTPWASERAIVDAVLVAYAGVQVTPLTAARLSPNDDGVADRATTVVRSPVPGTVLVTLNRRAGGTVAQLDAGPLGPGSREVPVDPRALGVKDGPYVIVATLTPADGGAPTEHRRQVIFDRTLSALRLRPTARGSGERRTAELQASFRLLRPARVTVKVLDPGGRTVKVLAAGRLMRAGAQSLTWNRMVRRQGAAGTFTVTVQAKTFLGTSGLASPITLVPPRRPGTTPPGATPVTPGTPATPPAPATPPPASPPAP